MEKIRTLVLKRGLVGPLLQILNVPLTGQQSRARNRAVRLFGPKLDEIEEERLKMAKELADKDGAGNPVTWRDERGTERFKISDEAQKTINAYLDEELKFDVLPSNEADIAAVQKILTNYNVPMSTDMGDAYDQICEAWEKI